MKKLLIIDDDYELVTLLKSQFLLSGYLVDCAFNYKTGLEKILALKNDIVILDLILPDGDGIDLCKEMHRKNINTPIIMLTKKTSEIEKVLGLELGADDYIAKPFSMVELCARVKAVLRRTKKDTITKPDTFQKIISGSLQIDQQKRDVLIDGEKVILTVKEYDLLCLLANNPGMTFSRDSLLNKVWGSNHIGYEGTVSTHISRLRSKIEKGASHTRFIITEWGVGYRFIESSAL